MARGSDESQWDFDRLYERDRSREPAGFRREPVPLSAHGTLKQHFVGRTKEAEIDRCYACGERAIGTKLIGLVRERACGKHVDGAR